MNKIDRRDYQISGYGISEEMKAIAAKILELIPWRPAGMGEVNVQDFDVEIYINEDPFDTLPTNYVIDIQIKGLGVRGNSDE